MCIRDSIISVVIYFTEPLILSCYNKHLFYSVSCAVWFHSALWAVWFRSALWAVWLYSALWAVWLYSALRAVWLYTALCAVWFRSAWWAVRFHSVSMAVWLHWLWLFFWVRHIPQESTTYSGRSLCWVCPIALGILSPWHVHWHITTVIPILNKLFLIPYIGE